MCPQHLASFAYSDETLTIAANQAMLAPRLLAKLVQLAEAEAGDKALVVGGSCGYAAAIVAQLVAKVVALLPDGETASAAAAALSAIGVDNVETAAGALTAGWSAKAPYDVILVEGGVETVPDALQNQLATVGDWLRLVLIAVSAAPFCCIRETSSLRVATLSRLRLRCCRALKRSDPRSYFELPHKLGNED